MLQIDALAGTGNRLRFQSLNLVRRARSLRDRFASMEAEIRGIREQQTGIREQLTSAGDRELEIARSLSEVQEQLHASDTHTVTAFEEVTAAASVAALRSQRIEPPYRVLFLVHHIGAWPSIAGVVEEMRRRSEFEPIVASIGPTFPGNEDAHTEESIDALLSAHGIDHLRLRFNNPHLASPIIKALDPHLIIRQSQWDLDVPDAFTTRALGHTRQALIPYETMNPIVNVPDAEGRNTAVDSDLHNTAWAVFCTNSLMLRMAQRESTLAGRNFVVTGHPKVKFLRDATPDWPIGRDDNEARGRVIWSAHHSIANNWTGFGTFAEAGSEMLAWAKSAMNLDFVLVPHPALEAFTNTPASPMSHDDFERFCRDWNSLPNAVVADSHDYIPVVKACDVVITDGISMLIEPQIIGKPIVFLERSGHRPFNEIGKLVIEGVHIASSVSEAMTLTSDLLPPNLDPLRDTQERNFEALFPYGTESAVQIVDTIRDRFDRASVVP